MEPFPENALDITPFALPNTPANEIRFEEPRKIGFVRVRLKGTVPRGIGLSYLQGKWPQVRQETMPDPLQCPCLFASVRRLPRRRKEVRVNGRKWKRWDKTDCDVDITGLKGEVLVEVLFARA